MKDLIFILFSLFVSNQSQATVIQDSLDQVPLPLIDIIVDIEEFNRMTLNYADEIEIEAKLELYRSVDLIISEDVLIEVKGSFSAQYDLKSLGIKFNKSIDNSKRDILNPHTVLPTHNLDQFSRLRLRNSGNDFPYTMIKDLAYTQLAINAELDLEYSYGEQFIVCVNNDFYGLMNLRSDLNELGLKDLVGGDEEEISLMKIDNPGLIDYKCGNKRCMKKLLKAIDKSDVEYLKEEIDLSSMIDYFFFETYISNIDWPLNNVRIFAKGDEPFRFVLFDLDWANSGMVQSPPSDIIFMGVENPMTKLYEVLIEDQDFKNDYNLRCRQLLSSNNLAPRTFNAIVDFYSGQIEPMFFLQVQKFGTPDSIEQWYVNLDNLKLKFKERYNVFEPN